MEQQLNPRDVLYIRYPRRLMDVLTQEASGPVFTIYYGEKELEFDEPRLFPFARGLLDAGAFTAEEACGWSDGDPYEWAEMDGLLSALVGEGILSVGDSASEAPEKPKTETITYEAGRFQPRHWFDGSGLVAEFFDCGRGNEHLELFVPAARLAHCALDEEGRQVGERNASPPECKRPLETDVRPCTYPGSRFGAGTINVTALRSASRHWDKILATCVTLRKPLLPEGRCTVGPLYRLTQFLNLSPAWVLRRAKDPVREGELAADLASVLRVSDGLRLGLEHLLLTGDGEPGDEADPGALYEYIDRKSILVGNRGACAGPEAMIRKFIEVMVTGPDMEPYVPAQIGSESAFRDYASATFAVECAIRLFFVELAAETARLSPLSDRARTQADRNAVRGLDTRGIERQRALYRALLRGEGHETPVIDARPIDAPPLDLAGASAWETRVMDALCGLQRKVLVSAGFEPLLTVDRGDLSRIIDTRAPWVFTSSPARRTLLSDLLSSPK